MRLAVLLFVALFAVTYQQSVPENNSNPTIQPVANVQHKFGEKAEVHDKEHLKLHLEDKIDVEAEEWNPEKEMFHYFSMHDLNKDAVIDGLEIMKAITHDHTQQAGGGSSRNPLTEEAIESMVDSVLNDIDKNGDGLIDYGEYAYKQKSA
uniref:EF-hand domain-containing protein n=1 Tax=Syphacia muris TaxID=451379 RepID=A0A0N5AU99_9BILA